MMGVPARPDSPLRGGAAVSCNFLPASPVYSAQANFGPDRTEYIMDKDRVEGIGKQIAGSVKEAAGSVVGDAKLKAEGKAEKTEGKLQNAVGGLKDAARGK